jgi:diacylglycerol O-acyltransferase
VDNTLAYIDQGSFLALRALGRGPLIQFTWVYEHQIDIDGLRRLHVNLAFGLLGRLIERSALPFGRDRWVADAGPAALEVAARDRPRDEVWTWADERVALPLDPQHGPAWRLGVQPLIGGGGAASLVVSHSVGDAKAIIDAVVEAVNGVDRNLGYPAPGYRTRRQAMREDGRRAMRDLPETAKAVVSAVRVARAESQGLSTSVKSGGKKRSRGDANEFVVPNATVFFDVEQWDERARSLGGSSNSLFLGLAARLGLILGRVDDDGLVLASLPVSERVAGDTRANALTATTVTIDPKKVVDDLTDVRRDLKQALTSLADTPNELLGPLALAPWTPAFLVRRLEGMVQQVGGPIGCSNLGELPPEMNRPDGSEADYLAIRMMEPQLTTKVLERMGGVLFVGSGRINGRIFVTTAGWVVDGTNTTEAFRDSFRQALADMKLSGTVE